MSTAFVATVTFLFGTTFGIVIGTGMETWSVRRRQSATDALPIRPRKGIDLDKLTPQQRRELLD
jgi:hypothetical protein